MSGVSRGGLVDLQRTLKHQNASHEATVTEIEKLRQGTQAISRACSTSGSWPSKPQGTGIIMEPSTRRTLWDRLLERWASTPKGEAGQIKTTGTHGDQRRAKWCKEEGRERAD